MTIVSEKAMIALLDLDGNETREIPIRCSPESYQLTNGAEYQTIPVPGSCDAKVQFAYGRKAVLEMTLFFDTSQQYEAGEGTVAREAADVTDETSEFIALVYTDGTLHAPPAVKVKWGPLNFTGVVTSAVSRYTVFEKNGMPVQAEVDLAIMEAGSKDQNQRRSPFESPDRSKYRYVTDDCNLWTLAYEEYRDIGKWDRIAEANGITDPLSVPSGTMVRIPPL